MMKNNKIVESLLKDDPHPDIDFQRYCFEIPTDLKHWDNPKKIACVNSFAFGGTNCHAVLSSIDKTETDIGETRVSKLPFMFCFSGQDQKTISESITEVVTEAQKEKVNLQAMSYSSTVRRDHYQVRKAVIAKSATELVDKLQSANNFKTCNRNNRMIFVFGGMGIAWKGMCKELMSEFQVFNLKMQEIDSCLKECVSWSLIDRLHQDYNLEDTMFGPIATFACQVALAALWDHLGVKPDCVLGQSIGEVAASHVAGIWSLSEAVKIIFHRTDVLAKATGGKMLLIRKRQVEKIEKMLTAYEGRANIGLFYSPMSCVISGDVDALDQIEKYLLTSPTDEKHEIVLQTLKLNTAYHSHHTDIPKQNIKAKLKHMRGCIPQIEIMSTVSGKNAEGRDFSTADYWGDNIREPVQFGKAIVGAAKKESFNIFLEIGPKPVLGSGINDLFTEDNITSIPSMKRNSEVSCLLDTISKMYEYGIDIVWNVLYERSQENTEYPKYKFCMNKHLYVSEDFRQELMGIHQSTNLHPFLKTIDHSTEHKIIVSPKSIPSVYEHRFYGQILIPGALYAEVGLALARFYSEESQNRNCSISMIFKQPVVLKRGVTEQLDINIVKHDMPESFTFAVHKQNHVYAEGKVEMECYSREIKIDIDNIKARLTQTITKQELYSALQNGGLSFGEMLQLVENSLKSETEVLSNLVLNSGIKEEMKETTLHPAILDSMLQTTGCFYQQNIDSSQKALPIKIEGLTIHRPVQDRMLVHTTVRKRSNVMNLFHISLVTLEGNLIAEIETFVTKNLGSQNQELIFDTQWVRFKTLQNIDSQINPLEKWLIVSNKQVSEDRNEDRNVKYLNLDNMTDDIDAVLNAKSVNLEEHSAILFLCKEQTEDQQSSEAVLRVITMHAMSLKSILIYLHIHNAHIPLFIVTENAMNIGNRRISIDLIGGSCWGFVRSILRERIYSMTTIVDLHTYQDNIDTLMFATVRQLLSEDNQGIDEFVLDGNSIWCQQILPNNDMPLLRNNKLDMLCNTILLSKNEDCLYKAYLMYGSDSPPSHLPQTVEIKTTSIVVHDSNLFPQCVPESNAITLETIGEMSQGKDNYKDVVAFFPSRVSTLMTVPKQCVIEVIKIPHYDPGFLTKLVLIWHHCLLVGKQMEISEDTKYCMFPWKGCKSNCKVKNNEVILILCSSATQSVANGLQLMFETMINNTLIKIVDINSHDVVFTSTETIIVSTIQLNKHVIRHIATLWPRTKGIVCMEQIAPRHASLQFYHQSLNLQIQTVNSSNIFTVSSAMKTMPNLIKWISNHRNVVKKIAEIFQQFPQQSEGNLAQLMNNSTIQLFGRCEQSIQNVLASEKTMLRPNGVYIVVGGLTGLGWECVQFLAKRGAGAVFILNRREVNKYKLDEIGKIEKEHSCEICVLQADVTDMISMRKAFDAMEEKCPRKILKGIYLAAGVLEDKTLFNLTQDIFIKVASPKIQGAWNLHLLTEKVPLDFFIMHSSVTAVFGNGGQSNYGAANAFLDSLAQKRRLAGKVGQSINWGPLNTGMLQDKPDVSFALEEQGYIPLSKEEINKCLLSTLMLDKPVIIAAKFNSIKLSNSVTNEKNTTLQFKLKPILDIPTLESMPNDKSSSRQHVDIEQLKVAETENRLKIVKEYIIELLTDVLGIDQSGLELDTGVENLGLDSMQAMTLSNNIYQTFEVRITPNGMLQQNLSVNQITDLICTSLTNSLNKMPDRDVSSPIGTSSLTYMEYTFYRIYCRNPADPCLYYVNEISLPDPVAKPEMWQKVAEQLMSRHEVLRTTFKKVSSSENIRWDVKRNINPVGMKPDFRIVVGDMKDIEKNTTDIFHMETEGPLRFIYICDNTCYFRTVFNSIGFDMQGIGAIFKDMIDIFLSIQHDVKLPDLHTKGGSLIVVEMEKVLKEKGQALKDFWKHWLDVDIPAICLGMPKPNTLTSGRYLQEKITLEPVVYDTVLAISRSKGLSIFKLITSFYQLLLHLTFDERIVAISTTVDVKQYIPNVHSAVGLGTNYIPLLAKFPSDDVTVDEFLQQNKYAQQRAIDHCVCPLDIISEVVGSEKITNIIRNKVVLVQDEFVTSLLTKANDAGYTFDVTKSEDLGTHTETQFSMWSRTNEKQITLVLTYNSDIVPQNRARDLMNAFLEMSSEISRNPSVTIKGLYNKQSIKILRSQKTIDTEDTKL